MTRPTFPHTEETSYSHVIGYIKQDEGILTKPGSNSKRVSHYSYSTSGTPCLTLVYIIRIEYDFVRVINDM